MGKDLEGRQKENKMGMARPKDELEDLDRPLYVVGTIMLVIFLILLLALYTFLNWVF